MNENRTKILEMLAQGKISVEEYELSLQQISHGRRQGKVLIEMGALSKSGVVNEMPKIDCCLLGIEMGATFVARSFSGDKQHLVPILKAAIRHRGPDGDGFQLAASGGKGGGIALATVSEEEPPATLFAVITDYAAYPRLLCPFTLDVDVTAIAGDAVRAARARGISIERIHRADRTGYKAGALANGLVRRPARSGEPSAAEASNPRPSSRTVTRARPSSKANAIRTLRALACLRTLVSASCRMRKSCTSTSGSNALSVNFSEPSSWVWMP